MLTLIANKDITRINSFKKSCPKVGEYSNVKEELIWWLNNPVSMEKVDCPGIILGEFIDPNGAREIYNIKSPNYDWIVLDFDNEYTDEKKQILEDRRLSEYFSIEDFTSQFKDYEFYLHTSSSHTKEKNKFRVYMPIESFKYSPEEYTIYREFMCDEFIYADSCSFELARIMFVPNDLKGNYSFVINEGKKYNLSRGKFISHKRSVNLKNIQLLKRKQFNSGSIDYFYDLMIQRWLVNAWVEGNRFYAARSFTTACKHAGIDLQLVIDALYQASPGDNNLINQMTELYHKI